MVSINKMAIMAFIVWLHMAMNTTKNGVYAKNRKNVSIVKVELKNMHQFKSYSQNKIDLKIETISFVFFYLTQKKTVSGGEGALPIGIYGPSLYFWYQWSKGNGKNKELKSIPIFDPPSP